jgi:hypothetical protein
MKQTHRQLLTWDRERMVRLVIVSERQQDGPKLNAKECASLKGQMAVIEERD